MNTQKTKRKSGNRDKATKLWNIEYWVGGTIRETVARNIPYPVAVAKINEVKHRYLYGELKIKFASCS